MLDFLLEISRDLANKISLLFLTNSGPALKMYIPIQWNQCISFPVNLATDRLINMLTMLGISLLMSWPFILSSRHCAFPSFINYIPLWWHWKGSTSWGHLVHLDITDTRNDAANKWMTKLKMSDERVRDCLHFMDEAPSERHCEVSQLAESHTLMS